MDDDDEVESWGEDTVVAVGGPAAPPKSRKSARASHVVVEIGSRRDFGRPARYLLSHTTRPDCSRGIKP